MHCSVAGVSGRQAWLGSPCGVCSPLGLRPIPSNGRRNLPHRYKLCRAPQALPEGETMRSAVEAIGNLGGSHVHLADITNHLVNTLFSLADDSAVVDTVTAAADTASDVVSSAASAAADTVTAATAATDAVTTVATDAATADAAATAAKNAGWFGFLADAFENILRVIDDGLEAAHVPYSYGFAIILLTIFVKLLTFPLSRQQVQSSVAMQQLQPRVQEIQAKYKNNPEKLQQETAALYQEAGVNPLAGCLPTVATIPVFIGLYRSLTQAADEGLLNEGWFFIPSLAGPTSISARQAGMGTSWLFPFENGAPPVGWHDAGAYLILPVLLIISQVVSQKIISPPKSADPSQQQMQGFLSFLPFMLGWFSLNVPSGLTLYWITNNILSTGQQAYLKSTAKAPEMKPMGTVVNPKADPISSPSGAQMGSRRAQVVDVEAYEVKTESKPGQGAKFKARRAREAAKKAANIAASDGSPAVPENLQFAAPPDLAAEITPITENLERDIIEESDNAENGSKSSQNGSDTTDANLIADEGAEVAAVGIAEKKKRGKKGKKGKKGRKKQ